MVVPPPPPPHLTGSFPEEDAEALSAMLMSWYMSGFHTGEKIFELSVAKLAYRQVYSNNEFGLGRVGRTVFLEIDVPHYT